MNLLINITFTVLLNFLPHFNKGSITNLWKDPTPFPQHNQISSSQTTSSFLKFITTRTKHEQLLSSELPSILFCHLLLQQYHPPPEELLHCSFLQEENETFSRKITLPTTITHSKNILHDQEQIFIKFDLQAHNDCAGCRQPVTKTFLFFMEDTVKN